MFFFNDTATTEIYTLSLHDALPIFHVELPEGGMLRPLAWISHEPRGVAADSAPEGLRRLSAGFHPDRKSTRLNSSHANISYAVFCLKKKTTLLNRPVGSKTQYHFHQ